MVAVYLTLKDVVYCKLLFKTLRRHCKL